MAKVKPDGPIWGLSLNWYVCFLFRGNWTIFAWDIGNSIFDLKIQGQSHGQGQTRWSHLRPSVQSICLLFVLWQSDHFCLRYSEFHIWPWKFQVKVMAKVKPVDPIWGLAFNQYVCFLFHGNRTIFCWDIANSIFDLENSRSRSWPRSNPDDPIRGLAFNPHVCFLFRGNWTIFGWDQANSIFDLENSRSRLWSRWNLMIPFEA